MSILCRHCHTLQVLVIPYRLEVAIDDEAVDFVSILPLKPGDLFIRCIEVTVAAAFDRDL